MHIAHASPKGDGEYKSTRIYSVVNYTISLDARTLYNNKYVTVGWSSCNVVFFNFFYNALLIPVLKHPEKVIWEF